MTGFHLLYLAFIVTLGCAGSIIGSIFGGFGLILGGVVGGVFGYAILLGLSRFQREQSIPPCECGRSNDYEYVFDDAKLVITCKCGRKRHIAGKTLFQVSNSGKQTPLATRDFWGTWHPIK